MAGKQHELLDIREQIGHEIDGDAPLLAKELFGDKMPDMDKTSDAEALDMLRQKYMANDREWLVGEARRDPNQFLRLSKQLGVTVPH